MQPSAYEPDRRAISDRWTGMNLTSHKKTSRLLALPSFRTLWLARTTSMLGDRLATVTVVSLIVMQGHGSAAVSMALVLDIAPRVLGGPILGTLADRVAPRRLMISCDLIQAALFIALTVLATTLPILLGGVFLAATISTIFRCTLASTIPRVVGQDLLVAANSFLAVAHNTGLAIGPLAGGLLAATIGPRHGLWINGVTFLLSAGLIAFTAMPSSAPGQAVQPATGAVRRMVDDLRLGFAEIARRPTLRLLALGCFALLLFACLENAAVVFLAEQSLEVGPFGYGLLVSVFGIGMIVAPLAVGVLWRGISPQHVLYIGEATYGAATVVTGLAPSLPAAVVGATLAGAGNGMETTAIETIVQRHSPEGKVGVVYGTVTSLMALGALISFAVGGLIVTWLGPRATYVVSGAGVLAVLAVLVVGFRLSAAPQAKPALECSPEKRARRS
ncbi:MFS transporter [Nonomuraea sp. 10N515B]|uniref:MFS transporter n=1 Tax=Nonomuraea sp. 10N515B TaxID=3457422 RepID=UPI003FCCB8FA